MFWTTAFKPLRVAFQAELAELDVLLEGRPRVNDVDLYLSRVESLVEPWAKVRDNGVLGLDQVVDTAVIAAIESVRRLEHPAVVLGRVLEGARTCRGPRPLGIDQRTRPRMQHRSPAIQQHPLQLLPQTRRENGTLGGRPRQKVSQLGARRIQYHPHHLWYGGGSHSALRDCAELHEWLYIWFEPCGSRSPLERHSRFGCWASSSEFPESSLVRSCSWAQASLARAGWR